MQDLQKEMAGLNRQHAEAGAEQAAHAKCLQHKIVALEKVSRTNLDSSLLNPAIPDNTLC